MNMKTGRWIQIFVLTATLGAAAFARGETPYLKLSLLPEDESVYAPPTVKSEDQGTNQGGVNLDLKFTYLSNYIYRGVDHSKFPGRDQKPNVQFEGRVAFDTGRLPHPYFGIFTNVYNNDPVYISGGKGDAGSKSAAMEAAGITVSPSPARLGKTLVEKLKS